MASEDTKDDKIKNKQLIEKEYSYPEIDDENLQEKIYKKREFYYHKVPHRDILTEYPDIKEYRDAQCGRDFELRGPQAFISNFINPDTPYRGLLIFHGVGTGKCVLPGTEIVINKIRVAIESIWQKYHCDIVNDDIGEWASTSEQLKTHCYAESAKCLVEYRISKLYRQFVNESVNKIVLEDRSLNLTKKHKILTHAGWTNNYKIGDEIAVKIDYKIEWMKIVDIEHYKYTGYVYDLEIPKHHNYIANDIITHNTCAAIAVAEKFKSMVKKYNTKIYVLTSGPIIKDNWKKEILTCTGETYKKEFMTQQGYILDKEEQDRINKSAINAALQYYKIMSYRSFYRKVLGEKVTEKKEVDGKMKIIHRKTDTGEIERDIAVDKIENLNNTLIIADEAHNLTGNQQGEALLKVIKNSKNLKILLLTATPMKNYADDIVDLINFVRPPTHPMIRDKIFTADKNHTMSLRPEGLEYFKRMTNGYVSYFRGANPLIFAERVDKGEIPDGLMFTKVIKCEMTPFQLETYKNAVILSKGTDDTKEDALARKTGAASNFIFPGLLDDKKADKVVVGYYGKKGMDIVKEQLKNSKQQLLTRLNQEFCNNEITNIDTILYRTDTKGLTGIILREKYLKNFSTKFYHALQNINKLIDGKKGAGTAFVYSNLVTVGINMFESILLQNGYLEYDEKKNGYSIKADTICYFCGITHHDHPAHNVTHRVHSAQQTHEFHPATFMKITGKSEENVEAVPEAKRKILDDVFNNTENREGKMLKLILGSRVMNEGITLENVAEVHILDVFYNLGRVHQVIGRAIRQCKHYKITNELNPFPKVRVYKYVVSLMTGKNLTIEEELYKKAELKYLLIKILERALKEIAIDCPINYHGNIFPEEVEKFKNCAPVNDGNEKTQKCPELCDFTKCEFKCGDKKLNFDYYDKSRSIYKKLSKKELDYSTFTTGLAREEINYAKSKIKELYKYKYVYVLNELINKIKNMYTGEKRDLFDESFVFKALDNMIPITENDFNNYNDTIYDKYNVPGYLIYRANYYIFQPFDQNEDVPMYYRSTYRKELTNDLTLYNYLKQTDTYRGPKLDDDTVGKIDILEKKKILYDFDSVKDYYDNRDEYKYVGIIDKVYSKRKVADQDDGGDVFKIRPRREKILSKKRGTGIPSLKGAVCETSKDKTYLIKIANDLGIKDIESQITRMSICSIIKNKLLQLEKYSKGHDKKTYIMIPKNHPVYEFPFNLEDRLKYIVKELKFKIKMDVDVVIKLEH
ncbi:MAG: SNF2-like helicase, partial [Faunusvirus sp.]